MKSSLIEWIPIAEQAPQDGEYVLGVFVSGLDNSKMVFAMFYDSAEGLFRDADDVKRGIKTAEPIIYWTPVPDFPEH